MKIRTYLCGRQAESKQLKPLHLTIHTNGKLTYEDKNLNKKESKIKTIHSMGNRESLSDHTVNYPINIRTYRLSKAEI